MVATALIGNDLCISPWGLASDHKRLRLRDLCKELEISSARAYFSGAGAASQDRRLFGAFVPVS